MKKLILLSVIASITLSAADFVPDKISPAHRNAIKKAREYKILVDPVYPKEGEGTLRYDRMYAVREYYTSPFDEYVRYDDLIRRINEIVAKKIMICKNEHKVKVIRDGGEVPKSYDDISCLIAPLDERLEKDGSRPINYDELEKVESPVTDRLESKNLMVRDIEKNYQE